MFMPKTKDIKAIILICHGFGYHSSGFLSRLAISFAQLGYAVVMLDYYGHGRSDGLHALVSSVDDIANDLLDHLDNVITSSSELLKNKKIFVYGESLGGAVAFKICTNTSNSKYSIQGVILQSPMIKISDKLKPPEFVVRLFKLIRGIIPYAPIGNILDTFKLIYC